MWKFGARGKVTYRCSPVMNTRSSGAEFLRILLPTTSSLVLRFSANGVGAIASLTNRPAMGSRWPHLSFRSHPPRPNREHAGLWQSCRDCTQRRMAEPARARSVQRLMPFFGIYLVKRNGFQLGAWRRLIKYALLATLRNCISKREYRATEKVTL